MTEPSTVSPLQLLFLAGDGIGPEISSATQRVLAAVTPICNRPIIVTEADIGFAALEATGSTIPEPVRTAAKEADGVVLGPVSHNAYPPAAEGGLNPSGTLRKDLELYANVRPARTWEGVPRAASKPFHLTVMRENLEGFYADRNMHQGPGEFMPDPDTALAFRKITRHASMRIAEAAFRHAKQDGFSRVTAVHKANVMRVSDGLFLECCRAVAAEHPNIDYDELLVDAAAAHLVRDPAAFGVIVTTNMFGDILSDLASELSGGLGVAGSLNLGPRFAIAQAQHGSAPDIADKGIANPTSLILSLTMLLRHLDELRAAEAIETAVAQTLQRKPTYDLGGTATTEEFTSALIQAIEAGP
ncbi:MULTISPECIES: isocitrate/isopropylmalate dehydrogenase family protein [Ruegeria]|uniref:isocitrate/isopropylmalate dehydrogenase family protein n=1 Tax=Ruegeria TaxID=97050 RepID=UPI00147C8696|nr:MULTISPECIES: isocitrate/isopropylmalate dehydrogenase family protein [Ruegeria]NOD37104.1 isocitrate/isopropylmalate dehydrogenase family protein [Ruegeria sp. HKCCD7296]NOE44279.1 isocitrate/isopropylmalate dehydrogenase family protein [Ruegeria sp. HKCCD7319]